MADKTTINIDLDQNCPECGKPGSVNGGICLSCLEKHIKDDVQQRIEQEAAAISPPPAEEKFTDKFITSCLHENAKGDGTLYAEMFRDKYIYSKGQKEWYVWKDHHWQLDIMDESTVAVEEVAQKYLDTYKIKSAKIAELVGSGADDEEIRRLRNENKALLERARQLRGTNRRDQCLKFVHTIQNPLAISGTEFDQHPMLFPCANGVIDLETGKLRPGRPSDYLSACSPVEYHGIDDPPELWIKSLREIHGCERPDDDISMVDFLQRLVGYAMTGHAFEKIFPIFYGKEGWNGRSLFIETIASNMGSMAGPIPSEMLLSQKFAKSSSGPSPDVMSLKGKRIAFASETDENQRFSAAKIKWYTGNNILTGRWPNDKRPIDFNPTHTIFLESNYQPQAPANDRSFWERVLLIPHNISYVNRDPREPHERRANLNLRNEIEKERSKILGWMVSGCLFWQKYGIKPPKAVTEATAKYRENEDMIGDFVDECCVKEPLAKEKGSNLYNRFVDWYHDNHGKNEPSGTWFGKQLGQKFEKHKSEGVIMYRGLRLITLNT